MAGWMWRLYHATKDGRLFNYPVHLSSRRLCKLDSQDAGGSAGERDCTICRDVFWLGEATAWAITDDNADRGGLPSRV